MCAAFFAVTEIRVGMLPLCLFFLFSVSRSRGFSPGNPSFSGKPYEAATVEAAKGLIPNLRSPFSASFLFSSLLSTAQHHPPFFFSSFHQVTLNGLTLTPSPPGKEREASSVSPRLESNFSRPPPPM